MGLARLIAEFAIIIVACGLSFIIGVGVAVHHVRGAPPEMELEKVDHRKRDG